MRRWLPIGLVLLIGSGCAQRADWIQGTLVTVDVTGVWIGGGPSGELDLSLRQNGPMATGSLRGEVVVAGDEMAGTL